MKFERNKYANHKKGWIVTKAILPQKIIETIERTHEILRHIDLPKKTSKNYIDHQHRLMYCIHILYNKYVNAEMHIDDHLDIGDTYKQYLFWGNRNYHFLLKILVKEMNILQPLKLKNGSLWGKKQVRRYTFNPDFLIGQKLETIFYERRAMAVENSARPTQKVIPNDSIEANVQRVLRKVTITLNQEEIVQLVNSRSNEVENKIRANTYTKGGKIKYIKDGITKTISGQFKNKEQFIRYRTNLIIHNHINTLSNLVNESYNLPLTQPKRDSKAGRLYHQIISLPKVYYQYIRLDGERIGEIDMKNSQLCLFSHVLLRTNNNYSITGIEEELWNTMLSSLLEKESNQGKNLGAYLSSHFLDNNTKHWTESTPELSEWITATLNGELYKKIAYQIRSKHQYTLELKEEIKLMVMKFWFGDHRYSKSGKVMKKLVVKFPSVTSLIDRVKSHFALKLLTLDHDYSESETAYIKSIVAKHWKYIDKAGSTLFCICHQKIESFLFIDNILDYLLEEQYDVLPKHDSIICKQSEIDAIETEMILILDYYLGENTYKLSKKIYTEQSTLEEIRTNDNFINEELTNDTDCSDDLWEDYEMAYRADKEYLSQIDGYSDYYR